MSIGTCTIRAPRGTAIPCKGWPWEAAPRVPSANALLVPAWATWETFRHLEDRGLTMYGQMTAGSRIDIGSQEFFKAPPKHLPQQRAGTSVLSGIEGNAADLLPELLRREVIPDVLTDQASAHDALNGDVPHGMSLADALVLRKHNLETYVTQAMASMARHVEAMLALRARGTVTFDYGDNIRMQAQRAGVQNAFDIPAVVPEHVRPLFCEGPDPSRWVALSGDPDDITVTDTAAREMFADDEALIRWIDMAEARVAYQEWPGVRIPMRDHEQRTGQDAIH